MNSEAQNSLGAGIEGTDTASDQKELAAARGHTTKEETYALLYPDGGMC